MRPGQIQVFDGLRLTTEHLNHLQGSFHSAVQDIRAILGLGQIHSGFEVVKEDDNRVTVQPGLAFDFQKNRIVSEEPKSLEVIFKPEEETKYICAKYEQIEDGMVEGQPTLIWDSCSILLRATFPEPEENLVPLAAVSSGEGKDTFEIVSLPSPSEEETPKAIADGEETEAANKETTSVSEEDESISEPGTSPAGEMLSEPSVQVEIDSKTSEAPSIAKTQEGKSSPDAEDQGSEQRRWRLPVQQGVTHLGAENGEIQLSSAIAEPLRQRLSSSGNSTNDRELRLTLAEEQVTLDFPPASLSCQAIIRATFRLAEKATSTTKASTGEEAPISIDLSTRATAHGEATFTNCSVSQFGVATIPGFLSPEQGGGPWWASELTEGGIAHLPLAASLQHSEDASVDQVWEFLKPLELLVKIDQTEGPGFKVACQLLWKGGANGAIVETVERQGLRLMWESVVAWKAIGEPLRQPS